MNRKPVFGATGLALATALVGGLFAYRQPAPSNARDGVPVSAREHTAAPSIPLPTAHVETPSLYEPHATTTTPVQILAPAYVTQTAEVTEKPENPSAKERAELEDKMRRQFPQNQVHKDKDVIIRNVESLSPKSQDVRDLVARAPKEVQDLAELLLSAQNDLYFGHVEALVDGEVTDYIAFYDENEGIFKRGDKLQRVNRPQLDFIRRAQNVRASLLEPIELPDEELESLIQNRNEIFGRIVRDAASDRRYGGMITGEIVQRAHKAVMPNPHSVRVELLKGLYVMTPEEANFALQRIAILTNPARGFIYFPNNEPKNSQLLPSLDHMTAEVLVDRVRALSKALDPQHGFPWAREQAQRNPAGYFGMILDDFSNEFELGGHVALHENIREFLASVRASNRRETIEHIYLLGEVTTFNTGLTYTDVDHNLYSIAHSNKAEDNNNNGIAFFRAAGIPAGGAILVAGDSNGSSNFTYLPYIDDNLRPAWNTVGFGDQVGRRPNGTIQLNARDITGDLPAPVKYNGEPVYGLAAVAIMQSLGGEPLHRDVHTLQGQDLTDICTSNADATLQLPHSLANSQVQLVFYNSNRFRAAKKESATVGPDGIVTIRNVPHCPSVDHKNDGIFFALANVASPLKLGQGAQPASIVQYFVMRGDGQVIPLENAQVEFDGRPKVTYTRDGAEHKVTY